MKFIFLTVACFYFQMNVFAADSKLCTYNEWRGSLERTYEAHDAANARGWVPLSARLCKSADGSRYVILGHKAVGLGHLAGLPLKALEPNQKPDEGVKYTALLAGSSSYDDSNAYKTLQNDNIKNVLLFTSSKTQILAFHKELDGIYSNTLFLKESAE